MKLLIVGSRSITNFDLSPYVCGNIDTIISGGADGMDTIAEQYADAHKLSKYIIRPNYARYGRAAPLKRNDDMVDLADAVLIVWDGHSKGTLHTIKYVKLYRYQSVKFPVLFELKSDKYYLHFSSIIREKYLLTSIFPKSHLKNR